MFYALLNIYCQNILVKKVNLKSEIYKKSKLNLKFEIYKKVNLKSENYKKNNSAF